MQETLWGTSMLNSGKVTGLKCGLYKESFGLCLPFSAVLSSYALKPVDLESCNSA